MRALLIGAAEKAKIADLVKLAHENPLSAEFLHRSSVGFDPKDHRTRKAYMEVIPTTFTIDIPDGFRITYTEEQQPLGLCRHLSVSVAGRDRMPHPAAVEMLLKEFGFTLPLSEQQMIYPEEYGNGLTAVNVIEPMEMADAT